MLDIFLITSASYVFSSGLSKRIELNDLPDLINGKDTNSPIIPGFNNKNGTIPGLVMAGSILLLTESSIIKKKKVRDNIKYAALGGWAFAVGATNLTYQKEKIS